MNYWNNIHKPKNPLWFKILNLTFLLQCLVYPLALSIYYRVLFSSMNSLLKGIVVFALVGYPLVLLGVIYFNSKFFKINRKVATLLPILSTLLFISIAYFGNLSRFYNGNETIFPKDDQKTNQIEIDSNTKSFRKNRYNF